MGEFGLIILHGGDGGWQQRALLRWLLLGEYGLTSLSTHITSSLIIFHNFEKMEFGSDKANMAKYGSISMLNLVHETWDGVYCMMKLFPCGKSYYILCLTCIVDNF